MNVKWTKEKIRTFRKKLGITQAEFAKMLGITQRYVAYLEAGEKKPSLPLQKLLDYLEKEHKGKISA